MALESHQLNYNGIIWKDAVAGFTVQIDFHNWQQDQASPSNLFIGHQRKASDLHIKTLTYINKRANTHPHTLVYDIHSKGKTSLAATNQQQDIEYFQKHTDIEYFQGMNA